ncbi:MAG: 50S ribosomal protein L29 [Saprospiraceae bacterium]
MATKKYQELQEINDNDLKETLSETETAYQKLTFDHAIRGLDNPLELRDLRRDVARLKTEMRRREVVAMTPDQLAKRSKIRARRKNK